MASVVEIEKLYIVYNMVITQLDQMLCFIIQNFVLISFFNEDILPAFKLNWGNERQELSYFIRPRIHTGIINDKPVLF